MTDEEMRLTRLVAEQGMQIARLTNNERVHKLILEQIKYDLKQERAAVVAYLRAGDGESYDFADDIESGVHREPEEYAIGYNVWKEKS
jgi:hypothetical protein